MHFIRTLAVSNCGLKSFKYKVITSNHLSRLFDISSDFSLMSLNGTYKLKETSTDFAKGKLRNNSFTLRVVKVCLHFYPKMLIASEDNCVVFYL